MLIFLSFVQHITILWLQNVLCITFCKNVLNKEFVNLCDWFVHNKLSIHFGEDKTKCILFSGDKNLS